MHNPSFAYPRWRHKRALSFWPLATVFFDTGSLATAVSVLTLTLSSPIFCMKRFPPFIKTLMHMRTSKCRKKQPEVMVWCCLSTQHRLGHPGKQRNLETWDRVPSPNPIREGVGKRRRLRHTWEIAHQTRQSTGTGLTISRLARPMCDITVVHESIKNRQSTYSVGPTTKRHKS